MKITGNCHHPSNGKCPFLRKPAIHPGYTGYGGPVTWYVCLMGGHPRTKKNCELAQASKGTRFDKFSEWSRMQEKLKEKLS